MNPDQLVVESGRGLLKRHGGVVGEPALDFCTVRYCKVVYMPNVGVFSWPSLERFIDRDAELARLNGWWDRAGGEPISLYGRRRVGKSWLFRRFAHGKDAALLVASKSSEGAQLRGFEQRLEPLLGVRPSITSVPELFRVLFRAGRNRKLLAVIDEFPWLLPGTERGDTEMLSAIAAVLEDERDGSQLKLMVCGSYVQQMEAMMGERSPLHGRLTPLQLRPMPFEQAALFMRELTPARAVRTFRHHRRHAALPVRTRLRGSA